VPEIPAEEATEKAEELRAYLRDYLMKVMVCVHRDD